MARTNISDSRTSENFRKMLFGVSEMATFAILEIHNGVIQPFLEIARKSRRFSFFRSLRLKILCWGDRYLQDCGLVATINL